MSNPNPNRHTNREARVPTTHKSFEVLRAFAKDLSANKMTNEQSAGYAEGSGMQGGSLWTKPKQSKKDKQKEGSKHSSSSSGQPQRMGEPLRASGVSTQPSFFSANMSISQPSAPTHQNAPSTLAQRVWTLQKWSPGIWKKLPWENWTTAPALPSVEHELSMRTMSMEEELGYGHHRPSRPELADSDQPSYIDRNLLWQATNELNFASLLRVGKWQILTTNDDHFKATDNLNDAAIKLMKYLEIDLDPRWNRKIEDQEMERYLVNPRTRLSHAPIEKLSIKGILGDPLFLNIVQRFIQCGCPLKDLRLVFCLTGEQKKVNKGKIIDPVAKIFNDLCDTINELFAQRYAWGAGPEMQKRHESYSEVYWTVKQFPKPMDIIYGL